MSLEMRMANLNDLNRLAEIETVCFPPEESANAEKIKGRMQKFPKGFLVLTRDDRILGFINSIRSESAVLTDDMFEDAGVHDENGGYLMVLSLAVSPEFRGNGYGKLLLRHLTEYARNARLKGVTLTCKPELVKFYEKAGFRNQGKSDSVHGGFEWYEMRMTF
ncbi:MAG: GNAT family N-acetyltransferase [Oscillospiraceae bacterium]|nr:GNAT family N-acetyltransferase [Oscillospiraceae bacterium]